MNALVTLFVALMLVACENEGPIERAGETIDEAGEDVGDTAETVVDAIDDTIDDVEEEIESATERIDREPLTARGRGALRRSL